MKLILRESEPLTVPDLWIVYYDTALFFPTYYINKGYSQYDVFLIGGGGGGGGGGSSHTEGTASGAGGGGGGSVYSKKGLLIGGIDLGSTVTVGVGGTGGTEGVVGSLGQPTSFIGMFAYGGSGGGPGANGSSHTGGSGGAGGGGIVNTSGEGIHSPGPHDPAPGGVGLGGGGDGGASTWPNDPIFPADFGQPYGDYIFGGGGGGAGGNSGTETEYDNHVSHHGSPGGTGYRTYGLPQNSGTDIPTPGFIVSGGGGGGGGVNVPALTGQLSLISPILIEPGRGGSGGVGLRDDSSPHNTSGKTGSNGCAIFRIYV